MTAERGGTPNGFRSAHATTLNALSDMQQSIAYAVRRSTLADAESIIVRQEAKLAAAVADHQHYACAGETLGDTLARLMSAANGFEADRRALADALRSVTRGRHGEHIHPRLDVVYAAREVLAKHGTP